MAWRMWTSGNDATASFGTITYGLADVDKTYVYTVTESATMAGVTNDTKTHTVTVKITDPNKNGKLTVTRTYTGTGGQTFTNTYNATGSTTVTYKKHLENRAFKSGDKITFTMTCSDTAAPMPSKTSVEISPTSGNDADVDFGTITYGRPCGCG